MTSDLEPIIDEELRELVRVERDAASAAAPAEGKARVKLRLEATLLPAGGGGSSPGASDLAAGGAAGRSALAHLVAPFLVGAVVGGGFVYGFAPRTIEKIVEVARPPPLSAPAAQPVPASVPVLQHAAASVETAASAAPSRPAPAATSSLDAERALLDPARAALGRGDGQNALDAIRAHEQRFARGALVEEREAIAVQALVLVGRNDEARARGRQFLAAHPGSVLVPTVNAAIEAAR